MNLKDIPLQCTNVCASCPNPVPDAAAFISFSDLLCFQTGAPHLLISRQPELLNAPSRPRFVWNSSPFHRRFTGARGISKSDNKLLESEWWWQISLNREQWDYNNLEKNSWLHHFYVFPCPEPGLCFRSHLNQCFLIIYEWWWADQVDVGAGTHLKPAVLGAAPCLTLTQDHNWQTDNEDIFPILLNLLAARVLLNNSITTG